MKQDDLSCQPTLSSQLPVTDKSIPPAPLRPTPQDWGRAQAALAPAWPDRLWREALACLGIDQVAQQGGEG